MNLQHFKQENPTTVGSYNPSKNWSNYTHFAVMDAETEELIASCGYFQNLHKQEEWGFEDYKIAAESIEQAQLYANAPALFDMVLDLLSNPFDLCTQSKARRLLSKVTDIEEPVKRLLGKDAMKIILHIEASL